MLQLQYTKFAVEPLYYHDKDQWLLLWQMIMNTTFLKNADLGTHTRCIKMLHTQTLDTLRYSFNLEYQRGWNA